MLSKQLSDLSCNQEEFVKASSVYIEALRKSGYQDEILYQNLTAHTLKKTQKHENVTLCGLTHLSVKALKTKSEGSSSGL